MLDLPRYLLPATVAVLPLRVLAGTRFGFELPKLYLATWTSAPRVGQVTMAAAGLFAGVIVLATVLSDAAGLSIWAPQARRGGRARRWSRWSGRLRPGHAGRPAAEARSGSIPIADAPWVPVGGPTVQGAGSVR